MELDILVAAGGTGGHLFPATATLEALSENNIIKAVFVGSNHRIEARVAPQLGYDFVSIPVSGFKGFRSLDTLKLPFKILSSIRICKNLIKKRKISFVLCTGAYISYPAALAAKSCKVPLILMESNVSPGKSISMLASKADLIITSFEESKFHFKSNTLNKIICLGNPIRKDLLILPDKIEARKKLGLETDKPTVLIFGGSLGANSINRAAESFFESEISNNFQFIWQTGSVYNSNIKTRNNIKQTNFIDNMSVAYAATDLVICRSGATTLAELAAVGKPSILIPYPSASNNEQELNADVFVQHGAAYLIKDSDLKDNLFRLVLELISNKDKLNTMSKEALKLAKPDAAKNSAIEILKLIKS